MYFLRRLRPLEVASERVRSLRVSLNAPVITAPDLPAGPARAIVLVHHETRGGIDATVGVRSVATGEIAYWSFDGELRTDVDVSVAGDAALTFAESLGFLFEEVASAGSAGEKAFRAWQRGDADGPVQSARAAEPAELALDDVVAEEAPQRAAVPRADRAPARAEPPQKAGATLSKFRARDGAAADAPAAKSRKPTPRQPLARVQLVKRRSPEDERKLALRRLLTSF
jgi:hypothetical protein